MENTLKRLKEATKGCRDDMHEPDEQGINAIIRGNHLDNAMGSDPERNVNELTVGIVHEDDKDNPDWFNLATLIALARKANFKSLEGCWRIDDMPLPSRKTIQFKRNGEIMFEMRHNKRAKYFRLEDADLKEFREKAEEILRLLNR